MSIIEELFLGNIRPDASIYRKGSPMDKALDKKRQYRDELEGKLDKEGNEALNRYLDAQADVDEIVQYGLFAYALKFGVLLMAEIFMGKEETGKGGVAGE